MLQHGSRKHWQYSCQARILSPSECKKLLNMEKEADCKFTDLNMRRRAHTHGKALMLYHWIIRSKLWFLFKVHHIWHSRATPLSDSNSKAQVLILVSPQFVQVFQGFLCQGNCWRHTSSLSHGHYVAKIHNSTPINYILEIKNSAEIDHIHTKGWWQGVTTDQELVIQHLHTNKRMCKEPWWAKNSPVNLPLPLLLEQSIK